MSQFSPRNRLDPPSLVLDVFWGCQNPSKPPQTFPKTLWILPKSPDPLLNIPKSHLDPPNPTWTPQIPPGPTKTPSGTPPEPPNQPGPPQIPPQPPPDAAGGSGGVAQVCGGCGPGGPRCFRTGTCGTRPPRTCTRCGRGRGGSPPGIPPPAQSWSPCGCSRHPRGPLRGKGGVRDPQVRSGTPGNLQVRPGSPQVWV